MLTGWGSVLRVSFSTLTLFVGCWKSICTGLANRNLVSIISKN